VAASRFVLDALSHGRRRLFELRQRVLHDLHDRLGPFGAHAVELRVLLPDRVLERGQLRTCLLLELGGARHRRLVERLAVLGHRPAHLGRPVGLGVLDGGELLGSGAFDVR
jgi:hypothetical protein